MAISLSCLTCGKSFQLRDELAGRRFRCSECGETVPVPRDENTSPEPKSPRAPAGKPDPSPSSRKPSPARKARTASADSWDLTDDDYGEPIAPEPEAKSASPTRRKKRERVTPERYGGDGTLPGSVAIALLALFGVAILVLPLIMREVPVHGGGTETRISFFPLNQLVLIGIVFVQLWRGVPAGWKFAVVLVVTEAIGLTFQWLTARKVMPPGTALDELTTFLFLRMALWVVVLIALFRPSAREWCAPRWKRAG